MALNLYLPPGASSSKPVPMLFYLAGLTCTGDNGAEKVYTSTSTSMTPDDQSPNSTQGNFLPHASAHSIAIVFPDTSPRGLNHSGEDSSYDFGTGAGFYLDATKAPYSHGYKMESYITKELPSALTSQFHELDGSRMSIFGHSMGGHGALSLFLRNPGMYKSVSAFAPIANPVNCEWGKKAFTGYFGEEEKDKWAEHDSTELVKKYKDGKFEALIDVGTGDNFYKQGQLLPEKFEEASGVKVNMREGYDHSYYFIASFAKEHVEWAAKALKA